MKIVSTHLLLLLLLTCVSGYGQQVSAIPKVEEVVLLTDRTLFVTGEYVQFSALITSYFQKEWSEVLYVEIITPGGRRVAGNKYSIQGNRSHGCLLIPEEVVTGNYYARAYTKYMRNAGPTSYTYVGIKIVNPLSNEVLTEEKGVDKVFQLENANGPKDAFTISTNKREYAQNEVVQIDLLANDLTKVLISPGGQPGVCIAVVPGSSSSSFDLTSDPNDTILTKLSFYPESRGVSLTGQLKDGTTGHPVSNGRINLSIIGQGRDFEAIETDTAGRYYFSLPDYTGYRDLFLCVENDSLAKPILLVDNDFCTVPVHLPSPEFKLSAEERVAASDLYRNTRVRKHFSPDTLHCVNKNEITENAFYGEPSDVLVFDKFVQLPTLEEYFNELPSSVRVKKQNGRKYFKVVGERMEMDFFNPLVMVDWVAVNNPEKILATSPSNIARIEVITVPYIKGNITYGGIVSIISKRGDFAGIDLPRSGIFFNYLFLSDTCHCRIQEMSSPEIPDTRNTLYWNADLKLDTDHRAAFSLKAPATPGKYDIVVKGIDVSGNIYEQHSQFAVK